MSSMKKRLPLTQFAILSFIVVLVAFITGFGPVGGQAQSVVVPEGASRVDVAKDLYAKHIIRSETQFLATLALTGSNVKAGTYTLDPKDNMFEIVFALFTGPAKTHITITVPEGWRKEQIAEELTKKGLDGAGFLALVQDKEGYLFPDTYFFPKTATAQDVLTKFSDNYTKKTTSLNLTPDQLILASIVEREAKKDSERSLIAGIYAHRIAIGMSLEADPTVQYGKETNLLKEGKTVTQFWLPITVADYHDVVSPYNTYLHNGYPPSPICNPGMKSIEAALNPDSTTAVYFFHTKNGSIITSKTMEEHITNKKKYL